MSRACCPYDNVPMERYYNILKTELIYQYRFENAAELDCVVSELACDWYNQVRPRMYNGYLTQFKKREECTFKLWCYKKSRPLHTDRYYSVLTCFHGCFYINKD